MTINQVTSSLIFPSPGNYSTPASDAQVASKNISTAKDIITISQEAKNLAKAMKNYSITEESSEPAVPEASEKE